MQFCGALNMFPFLSYGDMRVRMAYEVVAMWQNLGQCLDNCLKSYLRKIYSADLRTCVLTEPSL